MPARFDYPAPVNAPGFGARLAASSLLSGRWSRDNLITSFPERLYDGPIEERIDLDSALHLARELTKRDPELRCGAVRKGVFTWDVRCERGGSPVVLQIPRALDELGSWGRAKRDVPEHNVVNMRHFIAQGLSRFMVTPGKTLTLGGKVPAATFTALPEHRPLTFSQGALRVESCEAGRSWFVSLGSELTAELLAEMIAVLVYHYEPEVDGGTAITDVFVNDGDFVVKRRADGSFDLRLVAARRRDADISPHLFLLYLIQMLTYEDWRVDGTLVGLPVLIANPAVAFAGTLRGLRYRYRDLGRSEEEGTREALAWIAGFGHSREGRAYRPWTERFVLGELPLSFGDDLREHWWRLLSLEVKEELLALRGRNAPDTRDADPSREVRTFLDRLRAEIGRPPEPEPGRLRLNDLGRSELHRLVQEAGVEPALSETVTSDLARHWPYRSLEHLIERVPSAQGLHRTGGRLSFGHVVSGADDGTLASLLPRREVQGASPKLANAEAFGEHVVPASLSARAVEAFPTFEAYMDSALHEPRWGYYVHNVSIGRIGHFDTHPEEHSPKYGKWIATRAFQAWRDMLAHAELSAEDRFPVVEFGAGNGRLARDVINAVTRAANDPSQTEGEAWRRFALQVDYHIYETSASLREKQRQLLGADAHIAEGDARRPRATLLRDFPNGLSGFVVTNEVPDAFGVHKVVLTAEGCATAALVVPRVEPSLREAVTSALRSRIVELDSALRETFAFRAHPGDSYLDAPTFAEVMAAVAQFPESERERLRAALWFEEIYVPVASLPELEAHLRANAEEYATALAAQDSGVVVYVNVHADRFIRELAASMRAGFIVTIDYGDTTWGLIQGARRGDFSFRVYGDWQKDYNPRPNDPYSLPGTQDMTSDVNFTALAREGQEAGLCLVHYGPERDVAGEDIPVLLKASEENEAIAEFLGSPVFRVLILGTRSCEAFDGPWLTPSPLYAPERDVPAARRTKMRSIRATLAGE